MKMSDRKEENIEIGQRLKELRENEFKAGKQLSQPKLALLLSDKVDLINLSGENGKAVVSQLERGARGLTIEMACAYADVFNVTLDFLYGRNPNHKPEHKATAELTGLSEKAIKALSLYESRSRWSNCIASEILSNTSFWDFVISFSNYAHTLTAFYGSDSQKKYDIHRIGKYLMQENDPSSKYELPPKDHIAIRKLRYQDDFQRLLDSVLKNLVPQIVDYATEQGLSVSSADDILGKDGK
jgi:transcriptional regulator with XRE-family HTH domain